jgi:hypothetical protein
VGSHSASGHTLGRKRDFGVTVLGLPLLRHLNSKKPDRQIGLNA